MKPNTKSIFFKLSILCLILFVLQLFITRQLALNAVKGSRSTSLIAPLYWLGIFWVSLGSAFYYKTTKYKQTFVRQLLVFILTPIALAPFIGIIYVIVVLLPLYGQISQSGFK
jgi:hypothetical protein